MYDHHDVIIGCSGVDQELSIVNGQSHGVEREWADTNISTVDEQGLPGL